MSWVRLDEEFAKHPKVVAAGPLGMAMQVAALCYCNQYLTDGFVPRAVAVGLLDFTGLGMRMWSGELSGGGEDASWQLVIEDLVTAGLWERVDGGWRIHDYHDYQPSREHVLALRRTRQQVGSKGGKASGQARREASAKQFGKQTRSNAEARDQAGSRQRRAPTGTDERRDPASPADDEPETLTSRDSPDDREANSSATAAANGQPKTNPGPGPVPVSKKKPPAGAVAPHRSPALAVVPDQPATAQTLLAEHCRNCKARIPERVRGHLAREIKKLLDEDISPDAIRDGLEIVRLRGLHPATLASAVNEALNPPAPRAPSRRVAANGQHGADPIELAQRAAQRKRDEDEAERVGRHLGQARRELPSPTTPADHAG